MLYETAEDVLALCTRNLKILLSMAYDSRTR
jgi:hypothetical protein